jgi:uncharacterized protein (TIGR03435 family)
MRLFLAPILAVGLCNALAHAAPEQLTFEVASVRISAPDISGMFLQPMPGGNVRIVGATLKNLIAYAYNTREFMISEGPGWAKSVRFDINGSVENASGNSQQIPERLRSLLAERFQLVIHTESKEQGVYALVVGKNGPKLREAQPESRASIRRGSGSITGAAVGMQMLVLNLSNSLERPVLDQTGLAGRYDFKLEWSPDYEGRSSSMAATGSGTPVAQDPNGPPLFVALEEQLGLRLEARKAPAETLVIDHIARPSEN